MAPGQIVGLWGARGGVVCCIQAVVRVRARGWTQEGVATGFSVCPLGAGRCWSRSERDVNFQFSRSERRVFCAPFNTPPLDKVYYKIWNRPASMINTFMNNLFAVCLNP